ncbi:MAG: hypothetical protein ACO3N7_09455 [Kiritimatiellia bacterium]
MKVILRILVILLSILTVGIALLPPRNPAPEPGESVSPPAESAPAVTSEAPQSQQLIRDLLGGGAIDQGKKARDQISELNRDREKEFEENGL